MSVSKTDGVGAAPTSRANSRNTNKMVFLFEENVFGRVIINIETKK